MDGTAVSSPESGNHRRRHERASGLQVKERAGHWHVHGTLRAAGRSIRVRQSTGLPADRPREEAEAIRVRIEADLLDQVVHGRPPRVAFAAAAVEWLKSADPRPTDIRNAKALGAHFGTMDLADITTAAIAGYARTRQAGLAPATVNRTLNTLRSILHFAQRLGWLEDVPHMERPKVKRRSIDKWLDAEDLMLIIGCAAPHLQASLALMADTGCRVSEAIYLPISDLILAEDRARAIFRDTKNGDTYGAPIREWAAQLISAHLGNRTTGPVFVTDKGEPYADRKHQGGGQIKVGFRAAKRRARRTLLLEARRQPIGSQTRQRLVARARNVWAATPHWLRHNLASHLLMNGESVRTVMEAGRWKTASLVLDTYGHLAPDHVRHAVDRLPFGTSLTHGPAVDAK